MRWPAREAAGTPGGSPGADGFLPVRISLAGWFRWFPPWDRRVTRTVRAMDDDIELTGDEHLRALAALEAVAGGDDAGLAVLAAGGAGEWPLPALLAAYGRHTLERILLTAFGITAGMDRGERSEHLAELNADPQARLTFLLTDALHHQAALAGADLITAKHIAISILGAVHAFTNADDSDALTLLRALRNEVLHSG